METKLIYSKIPDIIKEIEAVKKKKSEEGGVNYAYRRIDDFMNALNPLLGNHKVTLVPTLLERTRGQYQTAKGTTMFTCEVKMQYELFAEDGSSIKGITLGEGNDTGDKVSGKAQSNALKYFIMPTFMVPTEDIADTDNDSSDEQEKDFDPFEYVIQLGQNKLTGTKIKDHKIDFLIKYAEESKEWHKKNNKKPHSNTQKFFDMVEAAAKLKAEDIPF